MVKTGDESLPNSICEIYTRFHGDSFPSFVRFWFLTTNSEYFDQFSHAGKIFEKLKEKGYRLIGAQCVMSCLQLELPVPKVSHPVYNVAMLNTVVCCSSMKKNERMQLHQLVLSMGGEVRKFLVISSSHFPMLCGYE